MKGLRKDLGLDLVMKLRLSQNLGLKQGLGLDLSQRLEEIKGRVLKVDVTGKTMRNTLSQPLASALECEHLSDSTGLELGP